MSTVIITACSKQTMRNALSLNERGWTIKRVAEKLGFSRQTMARYYRVHDMYGIDAFIPLIARK